MIGKSALAPVFHMLDVYAVPVCRSPIHRAILLTDLGPGPYSPVLIV